MKSNAVKFIGKELNVIIDRPLGSSHPNYPESIYMVNYGYVPNMVSGDGEEIDCYITIFLTMFYCCLYINDIESIHNNSINISNNNFLCK